MQCAPGECYWLRVATCRSCTVIVNGRMQRVSIGVLELLDFAIAKRVGISVNYNIRHPTLLPSNNMRELALVR